MDLQIGKTYRTRNGMTVKIENDHSEIERSYPMYGEIMNGDKFHRIGYFARSGNYSWTTSDLDIIEEIN